MDQILKGLLGIVVFIAAGGGILLWVYLMNSMRSPESMGEPEKPKHLGTHPLEDD